MTNPTSAEEIIEAIQQAFSSSDLDEITLEFEQVSQNVADRVIEFLDENYENRGRRYALFFFFFFFSRLGLRPHASN